MHKSIKIAIVDDHGLFVEGLAYIINDFKGIQLVMKAENGIDLIQKLKSQRLDVILLDLKMPKMDGFKTAVYVLQEYPEIKIITLTMYDEKKFIIEAIKIGVHGYLLKNAESSEIETAIHSVMEKDFYFNDHVTEALYKGWAHKKKIKPFINKADRLTKRELQMLKLICKQHTGPEIANKLNLSPKTIENYRYKLQEKLNVRNTVVLVVYAIQNNLVRIDMKKKSSW